MLVFILTLAAVPVLLAFALADDFRDAVFRATIGIVGVVALLAVVTLTEIAQDQPPQIALHLTNAGGHE